MPWHLVDLWWEMGKEATIDSFSVEMMISADVPPESRIFLAGFCSKINDQSTYAGIVTDLDASTRRDPKPRPIGPGGHFRRWGKRGHENIRPALGGYFLDEDSEKDFVDVSAQYRWKKGKYTLKIVKMEVEKSPEGGNVWAGAFLYSHENDETLFMGALRFRGQALQLADRVCTFLELYDKPVRVRDIPALSVTLSNLQVNGVAVKKPVVNAYYPRQVPACADVLRKGDDITITMAPLEKKRTIRWVEVTERKDEPKENKEKENKADAARFR